MEDKQQVTLYFPPELHKQLKIQAAVQSDTMSAITMRAVDFYLKHAAIVEELENAYGGTHQVYHCPSCTTPVVVKDGELVSLSGQPTVQDDISESVPELVGKQRPEEGELVPC